jgi:hypothetical protein
MYNIRMELKHTSIPPEFLNVLPEGIKFVHKQDKEFLVVEEVYCPKGHSLMVDSVKIHHEPSIRISVTIQDQHGAFFIDAFWGSHAKLYSFMPQITGSYPAIQASCPECGISLMEERECIIDGCDSDTHIVFHLPGERNRIYVCAQLGCPGHYLDISTLPSTIAQSVSEINYFGAQTEEEMFRGI